MKEATLFVANNPDILTITPPGSSEVIKIDPTGRLFWHGREVETDADFRAAMMDLAKHLFPARPGPERLGFEEWFKRTCPIQYHGERERYERDLAQQETLRDATAESGK